MSRIVSLGALPTIEDPAGAGGDSPSREGKSLEEVLNWVEITRTVKPAAEVDFRDDVASEDAAIWASSRDPDQWGSSWASYEDEDGFEDASSARRRKLASSQAPSRQPVPLVGPDHSSNVHQRLSEEIEDINALESAREPTSLEDLLRSMEIAKLEQQHTPEAPYISEIMSVDTPSPRELWDPITPRAAPHQATEDGPLQDLSPVTPPHGPHGTRSRQGSAQAGYPDELSLMNAPVPNDMVGVARQLPPEAEAESLAAITKWLGSGVTSSDLDTLFQQRKSAANMAISPLPAPAFLSEPQQPAEIPKQPSFADVPMERLFMEDLCNKPNPIQVRLPSLLPDTIANSSGDSQRPLRDEMISYGGDIDVSTIPDTLHSGKLQRVSSPIMALDPLVDPLPDPGSPGRWADDLHPSFSHKDNKDASMALKLYELSRHQGDTQPDSLHSEDEDDEADEDPSRKPKCPRSVIESIGAEDWIKTALQVLSRLEEAALAQQSGAIPHRRPYKHDELHALRLLDSATVAQHSVVIAHRLGDASLIRTCGVLLTLSRLEPGELERDIDAITQYFGHWSVLIRWTALVVMKKLRVHALAMSGDVLARCLADLDLNVRQMAMVTLDELDLTGLLQRVGVTEDVYDVHHRLLEALTLVDTSLDFPGGNSLLHCAVQLGLVQVVGFFAVRHRVALLDATNVDSETPLHVAAALGNLGICKQLVGAGALTTATTVRGKTPEDLALLGEHKHVAAWLNSRCSVSTMRVGSGQAFAVAVCDSRPIQKIEWYTMRPPGVRFTAGIKHSVLAITVGYPEEVWHTYVMEKAATNSDMNQLEQFKNDVFVSHWRDVAPNIDADPIHTLEAHQIGKFELSVRTLRDVAVDLGPYHVATCNCHHMALSTYNFCASDSFRVNDLEMPNGMLTRIAGLGHAVGFV